MDTARTLVETPLAGEHRKAGAHLEEFWDCLLPAGFSDFEKEYAAARESVALFDTNWHGIFELTGLDRVKYLHAITSNNIQGLEEGRGIPALLLNPQGHILAELEVYARAEKLLVRVHASARERTLATLEKYILASDVKIEDVTQKLGSVTVEGPAANLLVEQACGAHLGSLLEMGLKEVNVQMIPCVLLRRSQFDEIGAEFLARREWLPVLWQKLLEAARARLGEPIGMETLNALRLEAGVPWFGADFGEATIPQEAAVETTHVSFTKGCYTGQEIVERVRSRGHVNRKRVRLKFSTPAPPMAGTRLRAAGADAGYVTSAAFSPQAGTAIGMGYVRHEYFPPDSTVEFDGGTAEVLAEK